VYPNHECTLVIRCPKTLKVPKDLEELEVEAFFSGLVNKNGCKYMQCGDPELIARIKNLWMVLDKKNMASKFMFDSHCHGHGYNLQEEGESCHKLGPICNLDEKIVNEKKFFRFRTRRP
jgi:hypothetical protein